MKLNLTAVVLTALAMATANAAPATAVKPLLSKVASSGFVANGYQESTACEVFADRVVITTSLFGSGIQTKEIKAAKTNLTQINELLKKALVGQIQEKSGPVDGPTTVLSGNLVSDTGTIVNVVLSENNGGSGRVRKNMASEADILIFTLGKLCK